MVNTIPINQKLSAIEKEAKHFNHYMRTHIEETPSPS